MDMNYVDELMWEIKKCKRELQDAHLEYDIADEDMIDSISYKIKSLTSRYEALSRRLKKEVFPKDFPELVEKEKSKQNKFSKILNFFK